MKKNDKLLYDILCIQSETYECDRMQNFILDHLPESVIDKHGNVYSVQGEFLPFVVAHMDTVHAIEEGELVPVLIGRNITGINSLTMSQSGIGGDDKCGIYAALTLYEQGLCNVAFFVDEETGCEGSQLIDISIFENAPYIIQADRRGNKDVIADIGTLPIASKSFRKAIKKSMCKYGYSFNVGMMTDVQELTMRNVGASCINMSAGYYNPHCENEFINMDDLLNCVDLIRDIILTLGTKSFPHTAQRPKFTFPDFDKTGPVPYSPKSYFLGIDDIDGDDDFLNSKTFTKW